MIIKSTKCALLAGVLLGTGMLAAQASSSFITFSVDMATNIANATFTPDTDTVYAQGTFNGWSPDIQLYQEGSSSIYTNTYNDTAEANGGVTKYQFVWRVGTGGADTYEISGDSNLRAAQLPAISGGSVIPPTPFFNDAGPTVTNNVTFQVDVSQQIAVGNFTPGTSTVEVRGNFNGWAGGATMLALDPTIIRTNQYGLVTTNVYVGTYTNATASTNGAMDFKYVIQPGLVWDSPGPLTGDNGGNRFFTMPNSAQVLPVVNFSDQPFAPLDQITFNVDMSAVLISDPLYNPSTVTINGDFNGWGPSIPCTNNPAATNTNIYSAVIISGAGSPINYQFRYSNGGTVYDNKTGGGNRYFLTPNVSSTNVPAVFFNDVNISDLLNVDTAVTFSVNMTNAVGTDPHVFDPANDNVYINGDFIPWVAWNPISLSPYILGNNPLGSEVYTYSVTFPKGHARSLTYKYAINAADDEAGFGQNHFRYIRSTNGVYNLPLDKFGSMVVEPKFGNLAIGAASGGSVPITWVGYPNVNLQSSTNLAGGTWQNYPETTGASSTNWPASSGSQFFRLVQP
jgi:hypothetical protein